MDFVELGKKPISAEAPGGVDAKAEPEYEEMLAEIGKLTSPSSSGGVDWPKVKELTTQILETKSKDMMAATYLAMALLQTEKIEGLSKGFAFLHAMIETHWETMFPPLKRIRGRKNALEWFYEQGESFLKDFQAQPVPEEKFNAMVADFEAIDKFLLEKMEEAPSSRALMELVKMLPVQPKAAPPPPPPAPGAAPAPRPAGAATPEAPVGEIASPTDATRVLNAGLKTLKAVANYYTNTDLSNPLIYTINRLVAWMPVVMLPPVVEGATKIPAPPEQVRNILTGLAGNGDWEGLVKTCEPKVTQFLFWLDLSRMVAEGLSKLGDKFAPAADAVGRETAAFVKRLKGVENLTFADGTPFADPDTKKWLTGLLAAAGGGAAEPAASSAPGDPALAEVPEVVDAAKKLARDKKLPDALTLLADKVATSPGDKVRLVWRIELAKLLLSEGRPQTALTHLDQILADIKAFNLDVWDAALALEGYKVALAGLKDRKDEPSKQKMFAVMERIARLSPAEAVRLDMK